MINPCYNSLKELIILVPNKEEIAGSSEEMAVIAIWVVDKGWWLFTIHYCDPAVTLLTTEAIVKQTNSELHSTCCSLIPTPCAKITIRRGLLFNVHFSMNLPISGYSPCLWTMFNHNTRKLSRDIISEYSIYDVTWSPIT